MIGKISGKLAEFHGEEGFIETQSGVTYRVILSPKIRESITAAGQDVSLYTYLDVKEDSLTLFGFDSYENFNTYSLLLSVDGVGPKTAYTIVGAYESQEIKNAIKRNDVFFFQEVKGIGKKTAQRIIVDLASKIGGEADLEHMYVTEDKDAVDALVSLGFKKQDVLRVLHKVDAAQPLEERLKIALGLLTKK
ncbi:MAG: Holliday junction ATP-dependent DNA helicase RuvA [Microgenomates bacterium OLB23]|nr:MAG: Holliday junction ATP-dependent DNA helicase RuvA [Microgenomates bacterium OLB23]